MQILKPTMKIRLEREDKTILILMEGHSDIITEATKMK
jgi:hypothetical protein